MTIYNYYPGCTLSTNAKELDRTARRCAEKLGFPLVELPEWQCCGAVYPQAPDAVGERLSAVRALAAARDNGGVLVALCSACYHVLKRVNHDMANVSSIRDTVNGYLDLERPYNGETKVYHYLEVLRDVVGWKRLSSLVVKPLTGHHIGGYYGCMLLRPGKVMALDDPESPTILEDFLRALGADPVIYDERNECCGSYLSVTKPAYCREMTDRILQSAADAQAEELVTACPLCSYNLLHQRTQGQQVGVVYFTELLAQALGLTDGGDAQ
ncbi:MAG: CoB--CoM heterodisulfide reductase iron-sulfur subunit B family protein [Succiniclasticum sp.]|jgi:heterodisulfide reductase subunit B